jgi:branched-chain amino acid transport system permease protein
MLTLVVIVLDGLVYSSWLFIVAVGLTLIYGVLRIVNVAHGSFYALGAYVMASAAGYYFARGLPPQANYLIIPLAALVVGLVVGLPLERGLLRFFYGRDQVVLVLVTYAAFLVLEDATKLVWGVDPYYAVEPYRLLGTLSVGGLPYAVYDLCLIGVAGGLGAVLWWGLNRTRNGKLLGAVIHDREMSEAFGVNVTPIFTATFVLGAMLGALGGALTAPEISVVPGVGAEVIVLAFAVVVTGGLGSVVGAMLGALIVGMARAAVIHLAPSVELFVVYLVMAVVLALRPQGLFAPAAARKI